MADTDNLCLLRAEELLSDRLRQLFSSLFPAISDFGIKARIALVSFLFTSQIEKAPVKIWTIANNGKKVIFICTSFRRFLAPDISKTIYTVYVPIDVFSAIYTFISHMVCRALHLFRPNTTLQQANLPIKAEQTVAFVVHQGLSFGGLFDKNLYYSDKVNSTLNKSNILHIDYSGTENLDSSITWAHLTGNIQPIYLLRHYGIIMARYAIGCRKLSELYGFLILLIISSRIISYQSELEKYPQLKVAIIDYEVLCPKSLLLAFEIRGILTFATQERLASAYYNAESTILDIYCCASDEIARVLGKHPNFYVSKLVPVGQYRSDKLFEYLKMKSVLRADSGINCEGMQVIVALGFHAVANEAESSVHPLLNWTAHMEFILDILKLSEELNNVFVIFRFKDIEWITLPIFQSALSAIDKSGNVFISKEYGRPDVSYELCACADLVIAKATSLATECLSVGIPVLFHEYTHNSIGLMSEISDLGDSADIMCNSYRMLADKASDVLSGNSHFQGVYSRLHANLCGGYGDGKVRHRIHECLEGVLEGR